MEAAIAGLIGALIGSGASILTTHLNHRHGIKLQSAADALSRLEKSRAFQRENLLSCQDMMQTVGRMTGQAFHADTMAWRERGTWHANMLGSELNEDIATAKRKLAAYIERVADDPLRADLKMLSKALNDVIMASSCQEAEAVFMLAMDMNESTMQSLGIVLRKTY